MKLKNQLLPLAIAGLLTLGFSSCSDDDDTSDGGGEMETELTIAGFLSDDDTENYSLLLAAAQYAGLTETLADASQNLTVFAPNDAAFTTWLNGAALSDFTTDEVAQVLLNHVIGIELKAADVVAATSTMPYYATNLASGPSDVSGNDTFLSMFITSDLEINGQSEITGPDAYDASNGIIHGVDTVIDLPNLITFATADERVSTLATLLTDESLVSAIEGLTTATVLAPVNAAFDGFASPTGLTVSEILQYHVINGANAVASDAVTLTETPVTLQGETISVAAVDGAPQFTGNGNTTAASVVIADIQAINGVIHVIDTALLPAIPQVVTSN